MNRYYRYSEYCYCRPKPYAPCQLEAQARKGKRMIDDGFSSFARQLFGTGGEASFFQRTKHDTKICTKPPFGIHVENRKGKASLCTGAPNTLKPYKP